MVNKPHWFRWVYFSSMWWIADDMLVISVLRKSTFDLDLSTLILWKKINSLYTNYFSKCPAILLPKCQAVFKLSSPFCCYLSLHLLRCFRRPTGWYLEQSKIPLQTLCLPLDYLDLTHTDGETPWNITLTNDDKGGNPATTTAVHRTVMWGGDIQA